MTHLPDVLTASIGRRDALLDALHAAETDAYRLLHGAVEGAPGVAIDRYGPLLLIQTWREPLTVSPEVLAEVASEQLGVPLTAVWNHRHRRTRPDFARYHQPEIPDAPVCQENGLWFDARPRHGGTDPLLFLDFRAVRRRVRGLAEGRSVLNLFAYTCGIGVAALAGGASEVWNVDFAASSLAVGETNRALNGLPDWRNIQEDVFPINRQLAGLKVPPRRKYVRVAPRSFDLVVLDPPRFSKGSFGAVDLVRDYPSVFKPALLATAPGGTLICTNNVASVDRETWLAGLERSAAKAGRPIGDVEIIKPEDDFPSPDGRHPLKVAQITVP